MFDDEQSTKMFLTLENCKSSYNNVSHLQVEEEIIDETTTPPTLILLGGHLSKKIILEQGVPQGDVISPYICLLCVEILALKIKFTKKLGLKSSLMT